jgi:hypothetical protein
MAIRGSWKELMLHRAFPNYAILLHPSDPLIKLNSKDSSLAGMGYANEDLDDTLEVIRVESIPITESPTISEKLSSLTLEKS